MKLVAFQRCALSQLYVEAFFAFAARAGKGGEGQGFEIWVFCMGGGFSVISPLTSHCEKVAKVSQSEMVLRCPHGELMGQLPLRGIPRRRSLHCRCLRAMSQQQLRRLRY